MDVATSVADDATTAMFVRDGAMRITRRMLEIEAWSATTSTTHYATSVNGRRDVRGGRRNHCRVRHRWRQNVLKTCPQKFKPIADRKLPPMAPSALHGTFLEIEIISLLRTFGTKRTQAEPAAKKTS